MSKPQELIGLKHNNYDYPLADVSHLSEKEKKDLLKRGMRIPKELQSDEEFEQLRAARKAARQADRGDRKSKR